MTLCDYADSSKTPISDSVRVKKAISSIATNIKCKIQMLFFKSWHTCDILFQISSYILYHVSFVTRQQMLKYMQNLKKNFQNIPYHALFYQIKEKT